MSDRYYCSFCAGTLPSSDLLAHIEEVHVGARSLKSFYKLSCGICTFQVIEEERRQMIEHCFQTGHKASEVKLDWSRHVAEETTRIQDVIGQGVELLEANVITMDTSSDESTLIPLSGDEDDSNDSDLKPPQETLNEQEFNDEKLIDWKPEIKPTKFETNVDNSSAFVEKIESVKTEMPAIKTPKKEIPLSSNENSPSSPKTDVSISLAKAKKEIQRQKCHACDREITCGTNNNKRDLLIHGLAHTGLKFIKCRDCNLALSNLRNLHPHRRRKKQKNKRCSGKWIGTINEIKRSALRDQLARSYPGMDFEYILKYSPIIGNRLKNKVRSLNPQYGFEKRTGPVGKWDCRMCNAGNVRSASYAVKYAIAHSGLKPFSCSNCGLRFSHCVNISTHAKTERFKSQGCNGKFVTKASEKDIQKIHELLRRGFPEVDWISWFRAKSLLEFFSNEFAK